ncbi:RCC1 domain-containing protein [Lysinibacter cavernae]|uniref:Alpha-tubulin suppressor-like RCC1 family protein n=1 Tax=Lysinibacter cavernae TaxID=1640652 RepID=A0A7X5R0A9_9MICO|nr:hypothetical protein [Lysinibacter cavernae]NIH53283.1 alpha-tubulin suppressor-like RCC1 family protein [Lysinibacter cavernae]
MSDLGYGMAAQTESRRRSLRRWVGAATVLVCTLAGVLGSMPAEALWSINDAKFTAVASTDVLTAPTKPSALLPEANALSVSTSTGPSSDTLSPSYTFERSTTSDFASPTTLHSDSPTVRDTGNVAPTATPMKLSKISTGVNSSCGLSAGDVYCWGQNDTGQLAQGTLFTSSNVPLKVLRVTDNAGSQIPAAAVFVDVSVGEGTACAATTKEAYCWGINRSGNATANLAGVITLARKVPTGVIDGISSISVGYDHTCAIFGSRGASCWGGNLSGQMGNGNSGVSGAFAPTQVATYGVAGSAIPNGAVATKVSAGNQYTCLIASNNAYCFGINTYGSLGNGNTTMYAVPQRVVTGTMPINTVSDIVTAVESQNNVRASCAIANSNVYCWGAASYGALGNGTVAPNVSSPVRVLQVPAGTAFSLASGSSGHCVMTMTNISWCWGGGTAGQLGNGMADVSLPIQTIVPQGKIVVQISSNSSTRCWLFSDGTAGCAGAGGYGRLGDGGAARPNAYTHTIVAMPSTLKCATGAVLLADNTCSLTSNTTYYYRVSVTLGNWSSPVSAVAALKTA